MTSLTDGTLFLPRLLDSATIPQVLLALITIHVVWYIVQGFYRIYFHPLSTFPGPKIVAASRIPYLLAAWRGNLHKYVARIHERYGDVIRISPDELSFIDPQSWKDTQGYGASRNPNVKGSMPTKYWHRYTSSVNGIPSVVITKDPREHSATRRVFSPAFSDRALKLQEPLFMKYIDQLVQLINEGIKEDPDQKFNMVKLYNFTTFDVMGDLTFGESLHMLESGKYDPWVSQIFGSIKTGSRISLMMNYPILFKAFKMFVPEKMMRQRYTHFQHSVDRVTKRLDKGRASEGTDLWDLVLSQDEGKGLTRGQMDSNASLFMIAGTETTATLVSGLTWLLLKNPKKYEMLKTEVREAFTGKDMSMEAIAALAYLNACIKEALRMYPPVPNGLPRQAAPDGSTVASFYVPPNTNLAVPHYALYYSERNFKHASEFHPERWLGDEKFKDDAKHAFQPFHVGSRDCIGKNMAYHEMRLILAKVMYYFDYELCPESDNWGDQPTYTLWQKPPLMVRLKRSNVM